MKYFGAAGWLGIRLVRNAPRAQRVATYSQQLDAVTVPCSHRVIRSCAASAGDEQRRGRAAFEKDTRPPSSLSTIPSKMLRQYSTAQHNTTQHNTTQHNTTQHNTTQHNTTQHNTTQHKRATRALTKTHAVEPVSGRVGGTARECPHATPRHPTAYHATPSGQKNEHKNSDLDYGSVPSSPPPSPHIQ